MKQITRYDGTTELVYQDADLDRLTPVFRKLEAAWTRLWQERGSKDEGTCCLGVGFSVRYVGPRKRKAEDRMVIRWQGSQGDSEAQRTKDAVLGWLADLGIEGVRYEYGVMD